MESRPVIIFATASDERDYLRSIVSANEFIVLCFEKDSNCFDNILSIDPQAIILKTDSNLLAWRFILALHIMETDVRVILISNELDRNLFDLHGLRVNVKCLPIHYDDKGFVSNLSQMLCNREIMQAKIDKELFVGRSEAIQRINAMLPHLIDATDPILISGEAGTGKELLARIIAGSNGKASVFIKINCAVLQSDNSSICFLEDEIQKGPAEDASSRFECDGGAVTILLDGIDHLDNEMQSDVLFLIENQTNGLAGAADAKIRFISTSESDLQQLVNTNRFRKDLYYRLNVIPVHLPALKMRMEDVALLSDYFSLFYCYRMNKSYIFPSAETVEKFCSCKCSGNIDELESALKQFVMTGDERYIFEQAESAETANGPSELFYQTVQSEAEPNMLEIKNCMNMLGEMPLKRICEKFASRTERNLMKKALETTNWNRRKAAELLNISYKSMLNKIKLYEIV